MPPITPLSAAAARWRHCVPSSWQTVRVRPRSIASRRRPGSTSAPSRRKRSRCRSSPRSLSSGAGDAATRIHGKEPETKMQMSDSRRIPASKEKVWAALNNPDILKQCIPGCQSLEISAPNEMTATVVLKIGPVKATFGGKVTLSDLDPPNSYRIAGFAKGGATVNLNEESAAVTILSYEVDAKIGGKIAQLGGRLIDATATRLAGQFFSSFGEVVGGGVVVDG